MLNKGVVALLIMKKTGQILCESSCFEKAKFSGFCLKETQRIRSRDKLTEAFSENYLPMILRELIKPYTASLIMKDLTENDCSIEYIYIGHTEEGATNACE